MLIWTTTPWTLPANLAITLHPDFDYVAVAVADEIWILAEGLLEACTKLFGIEHLRSCGDFAPPNCRASRCRHPFIDRDSVLVLGNHVTLEAGTGCVHTAPGHGREDYEMALEYGLDVYSPVDDDGRFTRTCPSLPVNLCLTPTRPSMPSCRKLGRLILEAIFKHSYPALLAVQEAGYFPGYRAMVHFHGAKRAA